MTDDAALLRRYAEEQSEAAFAELVRWHIDWVYATALQRTGDVHRAEDVAQQVLARVALHARSLARHAAPGALHAGAAASSHLWLVSPKNH